MAKIQGSDLEALRTAVEANLEQRGGIEHVNRLCRQDRENGHSPASLRWALFYATGFRFGDGIGIHGDVDIPGGVDDAHIDTAMRTILKDAGVTAALD